MSDFHATVARIHTRECPLCGGELTHLDHWARCEPCGVGWAVQGVHDSIPDGAGVIGMGPQIVTSRKLEPDEIRRLYARPTEEGT
jgi:hypothetical protein